MQVIKIIVMMSPGVECCLSFRCKQWVVNCCTANLNQKTFTELAANYLVCGDHFEDRMFMNSTTRNSLVHNAVPTLFNFPHRSPSAAPLRKQTLPVFSEIDQHSPPLKNDKNAENVVLIEKSQTENQGKVNVKNEDVCMSTMNSSLHQERLQTLSSHNVKAMPVVQNPQKSLPTSCVSPCCLKENSFASTNAQPTIQNVPKW